MEDENKNNDKSTNKQEMNLFREEEDFSEFNSQNCFLYGDKSDCTNEDIFSKQKVEHKSSIDLNINDKKLHEFLNDDLIKALDNDVMAPEDNCELSDSSSTNAYASGNSENTSNFNSPELNLKLPKNIENFNMNSNNENCLNKINTNDINKNNPQNSNNINNEKNIDKERIKNENINDNIKNKIEILNDPLFALIFIPKNLNNMEKEKLNEDKESTNKENYKKKKEKKNNSLRNKFDDDVEPIIMLTMNNEEKTKLPLEIRVGDWICLYCNNLNFSFRIKCNRCGLLRKSSAHLLKKQYMMNNKYQYMGYNNYYKESYSSNYNQNNNYDSDMNNF